MRFFQNRSVDEAMAFHNARIEAAKRIYHTYEKSFITRPCPICGEDCSRPDVKFLDLYEIAVCRNCMTRYVNPVPPLEALADYYNDDSVNKHIQRIYRNRFKNDQNIIRDDKVEYVANNIHPDNGSTLLEIGCNSGWFLSGLRRLLGLRGHDAVRLVGIDIDSSAISNNVDKELTLINASAEDFFADNAEQYDYIVHFELLEHLIDPSAFCSKCHEALKPGGAMIFSCPNIAGLEMLIGYNSRRLLAHAIFPPVHMTGFSTHNIIHFLLRHGFSVERLDTPGKLDVDMVSLSLGSNAPQSLQFIKDLSEQQQADLQTLVTDLHASSHMLCVARKSD